MKRFLYALLCMVFLYGFSHYSAYAWGKKKKKHVVSAKLSKEKDKTFIYNDHGRKDPMLPVVDSNGNVLFVEKEKTGERTINIKIQGIIYKKKGDSKVMINGTMYKEGNRIGMVTIKKINKDNIIVSDGTKDYKLEI